MKWLCLTILLVLAMSGPVVNAENPWEIHAQQPLNSNDGLVLKEVFLDAEAKAPTEITSNDSTIQWTWWRWSESTGSDWPDDDAVYRSSRLNLSSQEDLSDVITRTVHTPATVQMEGTVKVVSAEDQLRFITFHLDVTPLVNLSQETLLYVVLTETRAVDHHLRTTTHLVREMRPEVGFSLQANNTTSMTVLLPADHLQAAGVDLENQPTGWRYSLAMMGGVEGTDVDDQVLMLVSDTLPSEHQTVTGQKTWGPALLTLLASVLLTSILMGAHRREGAVPTVTGAWMSDEQTVVEIRLSAGSEAFCVNSWSVDPPWQLKGRPPTPRLKPNETTSINVRMRELHAVDCHLHIGVDVDEFGSWRQHVWMEPPDPKHETGPTSNVDE